MLEYRLPSRARMTKDRRICQGLLALLVGGLAACGEVEDRDPDQPSLAPATSSAPSSPGEGVRMESASDTFVASREVETARPKLLFWVGLPVPLGSGETSIEAAKAHLRRLAPSYGVSERVVGALEAGAVHDIGHGAVVATFRQRVGGAEVLDGEIRVLLRQNGSLVAVAGTLVPEHRQPIAFGLSPIEAVAAVLKATLGTRAPPTSALVDEGPEALDYVRVSSTWPANGARFDAPARAKRVLVNRAGALVPAYEVETFASGAYRAVVSATEGEVLTWTSLVADAFAYTVWVETNGDKRPFEGPQASFTPHPRGVPDGTEPPFVAPNVVLMDGFNKNPLGTFDPWLPAGATETRGNNVDAYSDTTLPNGFSDGDLRASTTGPMSFARVYDVTKGPLASDHQQMAAVTQLFYVNNWLHDYFYDSGFDEAAGNAQVNNFGRGGTGGDPLLVEAQDGYPANRNNANMSTPADGRSPRMQMYVYDGPVVVQEVAVSGSSSRPRTGTALYCPPSYDVTAPLVQADDGQGASARDACSALVNDVTGKIVLVERGGPCTSAAKAARVTEAGGVGMIFADNVVAPDPPALSTTAGLPGPYVPTLSIRLVDGDTLRAQLASAAGDLLVRMHRLVAPERDGALDSTVVAHEWGHYMHHRLARCTTHQCRAMSEGWGDFNALEMLVREGDDLSRTYGRGVYSGRVRRDSGYYGNRRYPYSTDFGKNPLTFRHIMDSVGLPPGPPASSTGSLGSEVHNAGEVWASAMFEVYAALLGRKNPQRTFAAGQRAMADAVVAGLKITPPEARYTEQRDAILAALVASDPEDAALAGVAFAKRGLGACAVAPALPSSPDFAGVVESAAVADVAIVAATVDDRIQSCDHDGVLDAGETGRVTVTLVNRASSAAPADLVATSNTRGVTFPDGPRVHVARVPGFGRATATIPIKLAREEKAIVPIRLDVAAPGTPSCSGGAFLRLLVRGNTDTRKEATQTDDVEAEDPRWSRTGPSASLVWERRARGAQHVWHAENVAQSTDTQLVSPPITVSKTEPLVITFKHSHDLDVVGTPETITDGAVFEVSEDAGTTWKDVTAFGADPYTGLVGVASGTSLAGRRAFVGQNPSFPRVDSVKVSLGAALAGKKVRVRFRFVTDRARGGRGMGYRRHRIFGYRRKAFCARGPERHARLPGLAVRERRSGPSRRSRHEGDVGREPELGPRRPTAHVQVGSDCRPACRARGLSLRPRDVPCSGGPERSGPHFCTRGKRRPLVGERLGRRRGLSYGSAKTDSRGGGHHDRDWRVLDRRAKLVRSRPRSAVFGTWARRSRASGAPHGWTPTFLSRLVLPANEDLAATLGRLVFALVVGAALVISSAHWNAYSAILRDAACTTRAIDVARTIDYTHALRVGAAGFAA